MNAAIDRSVLVTIVIPVFNGANYLADAIDSALAQTWPSVEVLVVDDGSTDGGRTHAIATSYGSRIRLVSKPNGGVASALNAGIEAMQGKWFSWLSHDDLYHPQKIETQMEALGRAPTSHLAFGDFELMDEHGKAMGTVAATDNFNEHQPLWAVLEGKINGCTVMAPRSLLVEAGGFHMGLPTTQDYELWFRLLRRYRLLPVPGALVRQRLHAKQGSRVPNHLHEAGLLWGEMLESLTPTEMQQHARSELAFLYRAARFLDQSGYRAGFAAVKRLVLERLGSIGATLLWVASGPPGPAHTLATLREAGLRNISCVVADISCDALSSLELHHLDSATVVKVEPDDWTAIVDAAIAAAPSEIILFADKATALDIHEWRKSIETVLEGSRDYCLQTKESNGGVLPKVLQGAVFKTTALRDTLPPVVAPTHEGIASTRVGAKTKSESPKITDAARPFPTAAAWLLVLQTLDGESLRYAELLASVLQKGGLKPLFASRRGLHVLAISETPCPGMEEMRFTLPLEIESAARYLQQKGVVHADVLHTTEMDSDLAALLRVIGVPYDVTFLSTEAATAVSGDPRDGTNEATGLSGRLSRSSSQLIDGAMRLLACSRDIVSRVQNASSRLSILPVRPPETITPEHFRVTPPPRFEKSEALRVLLLGHLASGRGLDETLAVARAAKEHRQPLEFHHLGTCDPSVQPVQQLGAALRLYGPLQRSDLGVAFATIRPHLAWFPGIQPEAYGFALSDAMLLGLPVLARGVGAFPERLAGRAYTWVVPAAAPINTAFWLERLLALRNSNLALAADTPAMRDILPLQNDFYEKQYVQAALLGSPANPEPM